jgi:hypothetical protein
MKMDYGEYNDFAVPDSTILDRRVRHSNRFANASNVPLADVL